MRPRFFTIWLPRRVNLAFNAFYWCILVAMAIFVFGMLALLSPVLTIPIATLWYQPGFGDEVAEALTEIPEFRNACIYDDAQDIFVNSPAQLDAARMIEKAVKDLAPAFRMSATQRDPHFRVYAGGRTYYWSLRNKRLFAFRADRWTLTGMSDQLCDGYKREPKTVQQAFLEQDGIAVTEENFCCGSE